jgi:hypothetical protein
VIGIHIPPRAKAVQNQDRALAMRQQMADVVAVNNRRNTTAAGTEGRYFQI